VILGLCTALYPAPDLAAAKKWYSELLGVPPYFDEPFYVGFEVGGFELGLLPDATPGASGPHREPELRSGRGSVVLQWACGAWGYR
jgi:catechol 2,3-dioxygenase-like lactoylglutathione lyase family enzyme